MVRILAVALLATLLAACDTDAVDRDLTTLSVGDLSQDPDALVGTWRLRTVTGPGDCTPTCQGTVPASVRPWSETLTFSTSEAFSQVVHVRGSSRQRTGTYDVRRIDYGGGTLSENPVLFLDGRPTDFGLEGDRLYLDGRPLDGELLEYARR